MKKLLCILGSFLIGSAVFMGCDGLGEDAGNEADGAVLVQSTVVAPAVYPVRPWIRPMLPVARIAPVVPVAAVAHVQAAPTVAVACNPYAGRAAYWANGCGWYFGKAVDTFKINRCNRINRRAWTACHCICGPACACDPCECPSANGEAKPEPVDPQPDPTGALAPQ